MKRDPEAHRHGSAGVVLAACVLLGACRSDDRPPMVGPIGNESANLRIAQVVFTQAVQDSAGSLPLVQGATAAAKVVIVRSRESVEEVPIVLRLYRSGSVIHVDTTLTGGVLGPTSSLARASAEFLIPALLVAPDVSWQIEIDPGRRVPDSIRADNTLRATTPELLRTVAVSPFRIRLVPVILARHDNLAGDLSRQNADSYLRLARQIFPLGDVTFDIGSAVTTQAVFGQAPNGGDRGFWEAVLADVDRARIENGAPGEYWYGVVARPPGYLTATFGGFGYIPSSASATGSWTRTGVGFDIRSVNGATAQSTLAHELGHNFGRRHATGCTIVAPIDTAYPNATGEIGAFGHDVWSWANGAALGAQSVGAQTADVMSYCEPKWISAYSYRAVMQWRLSDLPIIRSVSRITADAAHRTFRIAAP